MRNKFIELAKAKIQDKRNIVISKVNDEDTSMELGFTVAQQIEVQEGNKITSLYMKNAVHIDNIEGLYNLRDALNVAISKIEHDNDNQHWDYNNLFFL